MNWILDNYIEVFGAVTGIIYVFLEIRQTIWLWPVGILTSAVYIWIFFTSKIYADMSLQVYYLAISILGWYWWARGEGRGAQGAGQKDEEESGRRGEGEIEEQSDEPERSGARRSQIQRQRKKENGGLQVTRLKLRTALILAVVFIMLYWLMWLILTRFTDSPVPVRDSFIT
ncbi:MAG TPA: nicotinamide riboside transporter PnuC, partial [Bacteroidales bacterium]